MLFLSIGMCNVFCEGLRIAKCLNEYGVTIFVGVPRIIEEMMLTRKSERITRIIDHDQDGSMEQKKQEGYF